MPASDDSFHVVFVCTGNICRSPMAQVVFERLASEAGLGSRVRSTSAGTGDWHVGERADQRTIDALARRGYDGTSHRARQFTAADFRNNDLVVALDRSHERILRHWAADEEESDSIALLLSFAPRTDGTLDVGDPYYGTSDMFDVVLEEIEAAVAALVRQLRPALQPTR